MLLGLWQSEPFWAAATPNLQCSIRNLDVQQISDENKQALIISDGTTGGWKPVHRFSFSAYSSAAVQHLSRTSWLLYSNRTIVKINLFFYFQSKVIEFIHYYCFNRTWRFEIEKKTTHKEQSNKELFLNLIYSILIWI